MPTSKKTTHPPAIDTDGAIDRVLHMMAIPGKSGQEALVAKYVVQELRKAGVSSRAICFDNVQRQSPIGGETGNLIVRLPGTHRGPRRLLMAHLDTVPLCVGAKPRRKGDSIRSADPRTALGGDDRAGAAVVLTAALEIARRKLPHPPLTFFFPVQEEIGLFGARFVKLAALGNPKLCFNWDGGSAATACIGATGAYDLEIEISGIASHAGGSPEKGVSAIAIAGLAASKLHNEGWHGLVVKDKSNGGKSTGASNLGVIEGGEATNVVTPFVRLRGEVRSHDPVFRKQLVEVFRKAFVEAAAAVRNSSGRAGQVRFSASLKYESFALRESEPCVVEALEAIGAVGLDPQTRISNGGLDANWLSARGLPTVTLGCGQRDVHTVDESLSIPDYLAACRIGLRLATGG